VTSDGESSPGLGLQEVENRPAPGGESDDELTIATRGVHGKQI